MVHFQIYSCLVFFLLIACHAIVLAEGRQLKSLKKQEKHLTTANSFQVSPAGGIPITGPPFAKKKERFPPQVPTQSQGDGNSDLKAKTSFRPTTPGNSPGAGNSFTKHRPEFKSEAGNFSCIPRSNAESDNGFKPTKPGNSPGVGHSVHTQIAKPKA